VPGLSNFKQTQNCSSFSQVIPKVNDIHSTAGPSRAQYPALEFYFINGCCAFIAAKKIVPWACKAGRHLSGLISMNIRLYAAVSCTYMVLMVSMKCINSILLDCAAAKDDNASLKGILYNTTSLQSAVGINVPL
jgi:hypothetical protein